MTSLVVRAALSSLASASALRSDASSPLTVWGRTSSSNTQKCLWCLAELKLPHTLVLASARLGPTSELLGEGEPYGIVGTPEYVAPEAARGAVCPQKSSSSTSSSSHSLMWT